MKIDSSEKKQNIIRRLRRVEGQIRGIQTMIADERNCTEILQQLSAASSALKSTSREFFQEYAALCMTEMGSDSGSGNKNAREKTQKVLNEMINLLDKTP
jgi:DNA-binding FrmR family transcriptional regulator